ncbi:MAG: type II toxin-antitoxin system VapC family toxin [Candidatus Methanomethylicia archaeon]
MRFVDASVFVHAFIKPKRELKTHEIEIKKNAKNIVKRINEGEKVGITVVQLAEISNILESHLQLKDALRVMKFLVTARNVKVFDVTRKDCIEAIKTAEENSIGFSDAIVYVIMKNTGIEEIYSFDSDFDRLTRRITE